MADVAGAVGALTVGEALVRSRLALEQAGMPDAKHEVEELYATIVRRGTSAAWLEREAFIPSTVIDRLAEAVRRRAAGWPQAYATGVAAFRGHWLCVDRRVLIPRPETEGLVELVLDWSRREGARQDPSLLVADVGTGSGAIAVALALEAPWLRIIATDRSADALMVARANVEAHCVGDRVELRRGHLLEPLAGERVDAVVSNPPYVASGEWGRLAAGVRDFEPREALDGGRDGLAPTRELIASARQVLRPGGLLALEVDARRAGPTASLVAAAGFDSCEVVQDLFGRPRHVRARSSADGSH
jgi:release factor glutamine methyltransferase